MTKTSAWMQQNTESMRIPWKLLPAGKDYLWGGTRLREEFGKQIDLTPLAETWECSTHPDGQSRLASDPGKTLQVFLLEHPEFMGTHPAKSMPEAAAKGELPILVKFIDALSDLSVQVHPDDDYAKAFENGQLGKSEMWYVVDSLPGTQLVYGFSHDMTKESVRKEIANNTLERSLQKVPVEKDDVFFIPAGTVHAIGAGSLIAEIQESSNLTYRLYDYHRIGKDGKERELHVDKALEVADLKGAGSPRQPMRVLRYRPGSASEFLCRCRYFEVKRLLISTANGKIADPEDRSCARTAEGSERSAEKKRRSVEFAADETSFHVLICTDGNGVILCNGMRLPFSKGDCFFVPAGSQQMELQGTATLLDVNC